MAEEAAAAAANNWVMRCFQAALFASRHNPLLKRVAERLRSADKPHKPFMYDQG